MICLSCLLTITPRDNPVSRIKNTQTVFPTEGWDPPLPQKGCRVYNTVIHLIVRYTSRDLGSMGAPLYCHYSLLPFVLEWYYLLECHLWVNRFVYKLFVFDRTMCKKKKKTLQDIIHSIHSWENMEVHTFLKNISPKVNVIALVEFELFYYDVAVQHFTIVTLPV